MTVDFIQQNHVFKLVKNIRLIEFYAFQSLNETDIELNFLFMEPEFIRLGYGKLLMNDFFRRIEKTEFKRVRVEADPNAK